MKEANKQTKTYVGRSLTLHIVLFYAHRLCMNDIIAMLLLVTVRDPDLELRGEGGGVVLLTLRT